uniref:Uncharacterized protein n=1 Tax=Lygus hesperus TaxID=30085 RepID=A0A0A9WXE8_LYGHE
MMVQHNSNDKEDTVVYDQPYINHSDTGEQNTVTEESTIVPYTGFMFEVYRDRVPIHIPYTAQQWSFNDDGDGDGSHECVSHNQIPHSTQDLDLYSSQTNSTEVAVPHNEKHIQVPTTITTTTTSAANYEPIHTTYIHTSHQDENSQVCEMTPCTNDSDASVYVQYYHMYPSYISNSMSYHPSQDSITSNIDDINTQNSLRNHNESMYMEIPLRTVRDSIVDHVYS